MESKKNNFRIAYDSNYKSEKYGLSEFGPSRTKQSFKDECDVNNILSRYEKTGLLPQLSELPQYGDFSETMDYQTSMNFIVKANEQFDKLPAKLRKRFQNDPAQFMEFVHDPENSDDLVKMGLATKPVPELIPEPKSSPEPKDKA